jgi:Tol biopolymer transport system component
MGVVVIAILTAALALSASAGAGFAGPRASNIAFTSMKDGQADIYSLSVQGSAQINLTHDGTIGLRADSEPAWSPDGQWVAFERTFIKANGLSVRLFLVRSNGKDLHALMPATINGVVADEHPTWSPDGSTIVFSSNRTGHFELYMVKATGTALTRLTNTKYTVENLEPAWAPDGRSIAFVRRQWSGEPVIPSIPTDSIYTLSLVNSATHRLTAPGLGRSDSQPAWSADSRRIAFQSNRAGNWDIYFVDRMSSTTTLTRVASSKYAELHPTWSPFGDQIAFISDRTGATELFTATLRVPSPTTQPPQPRQLTFDKAPKANPTWEHVFMSN